MAAISVVINTYNAEKHLREVLESVKQFDEIVICDMESTDNTLAIAKEYGCKVVTFEKKEYVSAEPARTFAIQSATNEWVLVIDADEIVPDTLRTYLYKQTESTGCPAGLWIARKNFFMGRFMHSTYPDYLLRFVKREGTIWPPYVHTFPIVQGITKHIPATEELSLIHLANDSVHDRLTKTNQYTENEIDKKKGKNYGVAALLYRPMFRFFKSYILKKGFLDGTEGFIHACNEGIYQFVMVSKIIERRKNSNNH